METVTRASQVVDITANEWRAARDPARRDQYRIYLVRKALSEKPVIEILKNPYREVNVGPFSLEVAAYELHLTDSA